MQFPNILARFRKDASAQSTKDNTMTLALAISHTPTSHLRTEILIQASTAAVWGVIADTARYPEWNPFIRKLEGPLVAGSRIAATIQPLGKRAITFRPTLLRVDPERELRWLGRVLVRGIFDGEHVLRLVPETGGTRLIHEELFGGLLLRFMDIETFRPSFDAMNEALKARAEMQ
jgi:hypothetical protein